MDTGGLKNDKLFLEADQLIAGSNMAAALEVLYDILNDDPSYAKAHNYLGWMYDTQLFEPKRAEDHFKHAIYFNPDYPSPYFNYFELLFLQKRYEEADKLLTRALRSTIINKDRIYYQQGRLYEAQSMYDKARLAYAMFGKGTFENKTTFDTKGMDTAEDAIMRCARKAELFDPIINNAASSVQGIEHKA